MNFGINQPSKCVAGIPTLSERGIYLRELEYVVVAGGGDPGLPRQGRPRRCQLQNELAHLVFSSNTQSC